MDLGRAKNVKMLLHRNEFAGFPMGAEHTQPIILDVLVDDSLCGIDLPIKGICKHRLQTA